MNIFSKRALLCIFAIDLALLATVAYFIAMEGI